MGQSPILPCVKDEEEEKDTFCRRKELTDVGTMPTLVIGTDDDEMLKQQKGVIKDGTRPTNKAGAKPSWREKWPPTGEIPIRDTDRNGTSQQQKENERETTKKAHEREESKR